MYSDGGLEESPIKFVNKNGSEHQKSFNDYLNGQPLDSNLQDVLQEVQISPEKRSPSLNSLRYPQSYLEKQKKSDSPTHEVKRLASKLQHQKKVKKEIKQDLVKEES